MVDDGGVLGELPGPARVLTLPENRGYGPAVNAGAAAARGEYLLVLNDDVRLEPGTVAALRAPFPEPSLFASVPSIRSPLAACGDEGGKTARFEAGLLEIQEVAADRTHPTLYPVGCCFLCPRAAFLDLQGYDDAFAPFFWEDVDLGYRAWARDLRTLHVPEAVCHHEGSATLKESRTLDEHVVGRRHPAVVLDAQRGRGVALRVEVDDEDLLAELGQAGCHADRRGGLADAALLVGDDEDARGVRSRDALAPQAAGARQHGVLRGLSQRRPLVGEVGVLARQVTGGADLPRGSRFT